MRAVLRILAILALATIIGACAALIVGCALLARRDPAAAAYGVERMRCVTDHDAAAEARACFDRVDRRYGQMRDGG